MDVCCVQGVQADSLDRLAGCPTPMFILFRTFLPRYNKSVPGGIRCDWQLEATGAGAS